MPAPKPGDYITAKCGRCNDITGHVVMLVLDGHIAKVECKACGSVHKYRETKEKIARSAQGSSVKHVRAGQTREQAKEIERLPRPSGVTQASQYRQAAPRRASVAKTEAAWQEAMRNHSGEEALAYAMTNSYKTRDFIDHPTFGKGEVIAVTAPDKIDVIFECGVKTLRCKA